MSFSECVIAKMRGRWRDVYEYADGSRVVGTWADNQIQNSAAPLVAALLKGEAAANPSFLSLGYMVLGSGDVTWDAAAPTQPKTQTTLENESFRKETSFVNTAWLDDFSGDGGVVVVGPSTVISMSVRFESSEANGSLREFGLFGGLATSAPDSGMMFNWIVHPKIDKDASFSIVRTVEIKIAYPV